MLVSRAVSGKDPDQRTKWIVLDEREDVPGGSVVKSLPGSPGVTGDPGSIPGLGRIPWRRKWQYSCLENPVDRGAWWSTVLGVAKRQT